MNVNFAIGNFVQGRDSQCMNLVGMVEDIVGEGRQQKYRVRWESRIIDDCLTKHLWPTIEVPRYNDVDKAIFEEDNDGDGDEDDPEVEDDNNENPDFNESFESVPAQAEEEDPDPGAEN